MPQGNRMDPVQREKLRMRLREKTRRARGGRQPEEHLPMDLVSDLMRMGVDDPAVLQAVQGLSTEPRGLAAGALQSEISRLLQKVALVHKGDAEEEGQPPSVYPVGGPAVLQAVQGPSADAHKVDISGEGEDGDDEGLPPQFCQP